MTAVLRERATSLFGSATCIAGPSVRFVETGWRGRRDRSPAVCRLSGIA